MSIKFSGNPSLLLGKNINPSFTSDVIDLQSLNVITYDIDWTGTFSGTLTAEVSNTREIPNLTDLSLLTYPPYYPIIWKPVNSTTITSGLRPDGTAYWLPRIETGFRYIRLNWVYTSGSGTMNAKSFAQSFG